MAQLMLVKPGNERGLRSLHTIVGIYADDHIFAEGEKNNNIIHRVIESISEINHIQERDKKLLYTGEGNDDNLRYVVKIIDLSSNKYKDIASGGLY